VSDLIKDLVGSWNVAFKQYRWVYTFTASGGVTWRDIWNGRTGTGSWVNNGSKIVITWRNSETKETWNIPVDPDNQSGDVDADYASGKFSATKDKTRFDAVSPEGQQDAFACWAACLSWYTRAQPDVPTISQHAIIGMSDPATWAPDGSITLNGIMSISLPSVFLNRNRTTAGQLETHIRAKPFPMLIAFASGPLGGHVNVIHHLDDSSGTVMAMEPWFPDPMTNPHFKFEGGVFVNKSNGDPFKFHGKHINRPMSFYTSKPLGGQFIVGFNSKFNILSR